MPNAAALRNPIRIGIVGPGELVLERAIPALNAHGNYTVPWAVGAQSRDQALTELSRAGAQLSPTFEYRQEQGFLSGLPSGADLIYIATPSRYHANNVLMAAKSGTPFCVEKPSTINEEGIGTLTNAVHGNPHMLTYFVEYYRDEKGIALRTALKKDEPLAIQPGSWYEQFFVNGIPGKLQGVFDAIGPIKRIVGTGIEDEGITGDLTTSRLWVNDKDQGGQFLDRSTHLVSFVHMLGSRVGEVTVEDVKAGICIKLDKAYREVTGGKEPAETYAEVTLRSQHGFPIIFAFGNYTGTNHRRLQIDGEHGYVFIDFATQVTRIESPQFSGEIEVKSDPKYTIIIGDLLRRYGDPQYHHEYALQNSIQSLRTINEARAQITPENTFYHEAGHVPGMSTITGMLRD